jgi:hypothetical protein
MQAEHPAAMHTLAMHHLQHLGTPERCMAAVNLMHSMAHRRPTMFHAVQARAAWRRNDAHHAFWHFLGASETGAEANLMNAAWILNRGCGSPRFVLQLPAPTSSCCCHHSLDASFAKLTRGALPLSQHPPTSHRTAAQ